MDVPDPQLLARLRGIRTPSKLSAEQVCRCLKEHAGDEHDRKRLLDLFHQLRDQPLAAPQSPFAGLRTPLTPSMPPGYETPPRLIGLATPKAAAVSGVQAVPEPASWVSLEVAGGEEAAAGEAQHDARSLLDELKASAPLHPAASTLTGAMADVVQSMLREEENAIVEAHRGVLAGGSSSVSGLDATRTDGAEVGLGGALQKPKSGPGSKLWVVMQQDGTMRTTEANPPRRQFHVECLIHNCKRRCFWENQRFTNDCMGHLKQAHGISRERWKEIQASPDLLQQLLTHGSSPEDGFSRSTGQKRRAAEHVEQPHANVLQVVKQRSTAMRKLTQSYVRKVVVTANVGLGRQLLSGFREFLADYSLHTGATHVWQGYGYGSAYRVLVGDDKEQWVKVKRHRSALGVLEGVAHLDEWGDDFHKQPRLDGL